MLMAVMRYFCFDLPGNVALKKREHRKQFIPNHRLPTFLGTFLNPLDDSEGSSMFLYHSIQNVVVMDMFC